MKTDQTHLFGYPVLSTDGEERLADALQRIGPYVVLPKGVDLVTHTSPRIRPQTVPESTCAYCASIITGNRCESCGAPRRAEKQKAQEWPVLLHDNQVRDGDGWRRTMIEVHPPKFP